MKTQEVKETNFSKRKLSSSSTECSTPPNTDFLTLVHNEESRYVRKGYGLIFAMLLAFSYFYFGPVVMHKVWPYAIYLMENNSFEPWKLFLVFSTLWHAVVFLVGNFMMWIIYHLELDFFERYKITSQPWPWQ